MRHLQMRTQSVRSITLLWMMVYIIHGGGYSVWLNPPYGREIGKWVQKAWEESQKPDTVVVMLLPARTDTAWFHDYCKLGEITFVRGRLKFGGSTNSAPFPSMVVVFDNRNKGVM